MAIRETETGYYVEVFLGVDYATNKKIRKTKVFKPKKRNSLKEAKAWEAETLSAYKTGQLDLKGSMRPGEYLDYWFDTYVVNNTAYQTQKRYKTLCECIKKSLGHLPLENIKTPMIERFYGDLKKEKITLKSGESKRRYMDGTILKTHRLLRMALDKAVAWEMIAKNPADYAKPPEDDERRIGTWSVEDVHRFFAMIENSNLYIPAFIAFHTGMREGEICALRWVDIDFDEGVIMVSHNMVLRGKELVLEEPKTSASKDAVVMTNELKQKLIGVKAEQDRLRTLTDRCYDFVCSWEDGRPISPLYVTKTFTKYVKGMDSRE